MDPRMMRHWLAGQAKKVQVTEAQIQRKRLGISEGNNQKLPEDTRPSENEPLWAELAKRVKERNALDQPIDTVNPTTKKALISAIDTADKVTDPFGLRRRGIKEDTGYIPFVDDPVLQKALNDKGVIVKKPNPTRAELEALAGIDRSNFSAVGPFDRDLLKMDQDSQSSRPSPAPQQQVSNGPELNKVQSIWKYKKSYPSKVYESIVPQAQANARAGMPATAAATMPQFRSSVSQQPRQDTAPVDQCESCRKYHPTTASEDCWRVCGGSRPQPPMRTGKQIGTGGKVVGTTQVPDYTARGLAEQLSPQEESIAKKMKPALQNMIDQYGEEKGTRVFYGTVRNMAKKGK